VRQSMANNDVDTEDEEATTLEAVTRRQPVKKQQTEDFVRAVVNCRVCEKALALQLLVVTFCKSTIYPITNPNPIYGHLKSRHYIYWQVEKRAVTDF
jgi:hypothetical protein